jgi:hypothetical protein
VGASASWEWLAIDCATASDCCCSRGAPHTCSRCSRQKREGRLFATGLDARLTDGGGPTHYDLTGCHDGVAYPRPQDAAGLGTRSHLPQPSPTAHAQGPACGTHITHRRQPSKGTPRTRSCTDWSDTGATALPVAGQVGYALPSAAFNQLGAAAASGNSAACNTAQHHLVTA